ncbi:hypothetical protein [Luteimonas huabeiensis]|uniref:hypothetical protein n=1 Tax=Luteimonas huabeiensis TaxID=1244513 RepID=UPI000466C246|nr:hypothetical protein [Luteimonas huabeiensis]
MAPRVRVRSLRRPVACTALALLSAAGAAGAQVTATGEYLARMDTDGDGRVSLAEYQAWMLYAFERMDADGDGVLASSEQPGGRAAPLTRQAYLDRLAERFRRQDADGDGSLDARELAAPPR